MTATTATMSRDEAAAFRLGHDREAQYLNRQCKSTLVRLFTQRTGHRPTGYSKDELANGLVHASYSLARLNEAIHVLHHDPATPWDGCGFCTEAGV